MQEFRKHARLLTTLVQAQKFHDNVHRKEILSFLQSLSSETEQERTSIVCSFACLIEIQKFTLHNLHACFSPTTTNNVLRYKFTRAYCGMLQCALDELVQNDESDSIRRTLEQELQKSLFYL